MRSAKIRRSPCVEALEAKRLLSGAKPVLTMAVPNEVARDVGAVMGDMALTHNDARASETLARPHPLRRLRGAVENAQDSVHFINNTGFTLKITASLDPNVGPSPSPHKNYQRTYKDIKPQSDSRLPNGFYFNFDNNMPPPNPNVPPTAAKGKSIGILQIDYTKGSTTKTWKPADPNNPPLLPQGSITANGYYGRIFKITWNGSMFSFDNGTPPPARK